MFSKPKHAYVYESNLPKNGQTALLIIDPQNDFHPGGSLAIDSANDDAQRIADLIQDEKLDDIFVTLDTHQQFHIAHGIFWINELHHHPDPFTIISVEDVVSGKWKTTRPEFQKEALKYVKDLETGKKPQLCIWPCHCLVGSHGACVVPVIYDALQTWEVRKTSAVSYVQKGCNSLTEHYSAFQADVIRPKDYRTKFNERLFNDLMNYKKVIVVGQAKSHCVNWSLRHLVAKWISKKLDPSRLVLIENCCSNVAGFEQQGTQFVEDMKALGVTIQ